MVYNGTCNFLRCCQLLHLLPAASCGDVLVVTRVATKHWPQYNRLCLDIPFRVDNNLQLNLCLLTFAHDCPIMYDTTHWHIAPIMSLIGSHMSLKLSADCIGRMSAAIPLKGQPHGNSLQHCERRPALKSVGKGNFNSNGCGRK